MRSRVPCPLSISPTLFLRRCASDAATHTALEAHALMGVPPEMVPAAPHPGMNALLGCETCLQVFGTGHRRRQRNSLVWLKWTTRPLGKVIAAAQGTPNDENTLQQKGVGTISIYSIRNVALHHMMIGSPGAGRSILQLYACRGFRGIYGRGAIHPETHKHHLVQSVLP